MTQGRSDDGPNFEGHDERECGEHRTVGAHRAWCFDCSEWCYPGADGACKGCERPQLLARAVAAEAREAQLRSEARLVDDVRDREHLAAAAERNKLIAQRDEARAELAEVRRVETRHNELLAAELAAAQADRDDWRNTAYAAKGHYEQSDARLAAVEAACRDAEARSARLRSYGDGVRSTVGQVRYAATLMGSALAAASGQCPTCGAKAWEVDGPDATAEGVPSQCANSHQFYVPHAASGVAPDKPAPTCEHGETRPHDTFTVHMWPPPVRPVTCPGPDDAPDHDHRKAWDAHVTASRQAGLCEYSGMTVQRCKDIDLCDCFDQPNGDKR